MSSTSDPSLDEALDAFYAEVEAEDLAPLWTQVKNLMPMVPRPATLPHLWRWEVIRALAERAGTLVPIDRGGDRRVLALANPGLEGKPFAASTLWAAVQYLGPRESAPGHRHAASALRFVLEGEGVWTTVDGDACDMHPGDVVLTPKHRWHDHCNGGDEPMLWFDGLDIPIVSAFDASFFEAYPVADLQPVDGERNANLRTHGWAGLRPVDLATPPDGGSPLLAYPWAGTDAALTALLAEPGAGGTAAVEFVNPTTGASALPTLSCGMRRITAGASTVPQQQVGHRVVVVYRGTGRSRIGEVEVTWGPHDMFVIPSWAVVAHQATGGDADLFVLGDDPAVRALGLYRDAEGEELVR
jgi:gentisate 1,2-dioxygenase